MQIQGFFSVLVLGAGRIPNFSENSEFSEISELSDISELSESFRIPLFIANHKKAQHLREAWGNEYFTLVALYLFYQYLS